MAGHPVIGTVQPEHSGVFRRCAEKPPVLPDIAQIGHQIFRRDEVKLFQRTGMQLCDEDFRIVGHIVLKMTIHMLHALGEQVADGFIVEIKGGAVDARRFADLLDRDIGEILLFKKRQECLVHPDGGSKIFALGSIQGIPPSFSSVCCGAQHGNGRNDHNAVDKAAGDGVHHSAVVLAVFGKAGDHGCLQAEDRHHG